MKRLLTLLALACAAASSFGATLNPIQLLNPAGSAAGQAIVSTGASSAPAWGGVGLSGIAAISANTVLANATGSSAPPTAFAMPSCSTSASALTWTTSAGFSCNSSVNAATLSGNSIGTSGATIPLLNGANTWSASQTFSSSISPSQTLGIVGTTTNNNANAGSIGEFVISSVGAGSAVAITSGTPANVTSISLTAGDWDVWGTVAANPAGTTVVTLLQGGISTTSATMPSIGTGGSSFSFPFSSAAGIGPTGAIAPTRITLSATTTVYLVANSTFTTSTNAAFGNIQARRRR